MTNFLDALEGVASQLGVASGDLQRHEHVDRLAGTFTVTSANVAQVTAAALDAFTSAFGAVGSLEIRTGDLPELTVSGGTYDPSQLAGLVARASSSSGVYQAAIIVDKAALGLTLTPNPAEAQVRTFIYTATLEALLNRGPLVVEQELWTDPDRRLVLLALDIDVLVEGECLSVVGAGRLDQAANQCGRGVTPGLLRIAQRRDSYVGWDSPVTTQLTSAHFAITAPSDGTLGRRFDTLAVGLGAMYLCDRARLVERPGQRAFTQTEFRGREHVAFVPIDWSVDLNSVGATEVQAVTGVVDWCYEHVPERPAADMLADRLPFVQTRVAQLLESRPEDGRLAAFAHAMPFIAEGVQWHWRSFVEGRVNEYLDHVRELEQAVDSTVERVSDQTTALTRRLTETSLAAVAALLASFLGAVHKSPFNAAVFRLGMLAYAVYVAIFPLIIGIKTANEEVGLVEASFRTKCKNLANVLGVQRVADLVDGRFDQAKQRFARWSIRTRNIYIAVTVLAVAAAIAVPQFAGDKSEPASPPATTTPNSAPGTSGTTPAASITSSSLAP